MPFSCSGLVLKIIILDICKLPNKLVEVAKKHEVE